MSDIEDFIAARKARNPKAWAKFDKNYQRYAIGMLLAAHRERSGLSLSQLAKMARMQKTALSRLENHGEDVRLSTISRYVQATGQTFNLKIVPAKPGSKHRDPLIELVSA